MLKGPGKNTVMYMSTIKQDLHTAYYNRLLSCTAVVVGYHPPPRKADGLTT